MIVVKSYCDFFVLRKQEGHAESDTTVAENCVEDLVDIRIKQKPDNRVTGGSSE